MPSHWVQRAVADRGLSILRHWIHVLMSHPVELHIQLFPTSQWKQNHPIELMPWSWSSGAQKLLRIWILQPTWLDRSPQALQKKTFTTAFLILASDRLFSPKWHPAIEKSGIRLFI